MTRQEAIEKIEKYQCKRVGMVSEIELEEALNMAIEALEQIESGRYVKGECSICSKEYGTLGCCTTVSNHWVYSCKEGMTQYAEALDQEPKRGKWIDKGNFYICSECGKRMPYAVLGSKLSRAYAFMSDYCPNCGARMESDEE